MSEADRSSWWLDATRTWRPGSPPAGWRQGADGTWHAPDDDPERTTSQLTVVGMPWTDPPPPVTPTQAMPALAPRRSSTGRAAGAHHRSAQSDRRFLDLSPALKLTIAALTAVILLAAAGVLVTATHPGADGGGRDDRTPSADDVAGAPAAAGSPTTLRPGRAGAPSIPTPPPADGDRPGSTSPPTSPATTDPAGPTTTPSAPTSTSLDPSPPPAPSDPLAACSAGQRNAIERGNHPPSWYLEHYDPDGDGVLCT